MEMLLAANLELNIPLSPSDFSFKEVRVIQNVNIVKSPCCPKKDVPNPQVVVGDGF